jgi:hypothetical protein
MLSPRFHFFFQPFRPGIHVVDGPNILLRLKAKWSCPRKDGSVIVAFFIGRAEGRTGRMAVVASNGTRHLRISL